MAGELRTGQQMEDEKARMNLRVEGIS